MATSKPLLGLGMAVVLLGMTGDNARADEALVISLDLDDPSSPGATPATTFKQ